MPYFLCAISRWKGRDYGVAMLTVTRVTEDTHDVIGAGVITVQEMSDFVPLGNTSNISEGNVDKLVHERFFSSNTTGFLIEVGAARPDFLSIGEFYRRIDWRVLSIEPNPVFAELHRAREHEILEYACGSRDDDEVPFVVAHSHGIAYANGQVSFEAFSSLSLKSSYAAIKPASVELIPISVKLRRLDTLIGQYAPDMQIDVICIDVEGWELEVLSGLSFDHYLPKVLIVENLFDDGHYRRFMSQRGYSLWRRLEYNDVYVRNELLTIIERVTGRARLHICRVKHLAKSLARRLARRLRDLRWQSFLS